MDTKLLTYAELGEALGITGDSAKRLARPRGWMKQPGNGGRARVSVPVERLVPGMTLWMSGTMTPRMSLRMSPGSLLRWSGMSSD